MAGKKAAPSQGPRSPSGISYTHVVVAAVALFTVLCVVMMPYVPDDSYISFRYAENLADGKGLTFNPGEPPVEGYSNLLWILLCAVIYRLGMELPAATPVLGVIIGILIFLSLAALYRRRSLPAAQAAIPMLALAASGPFLIYTISGMETALFALLLIGTLLVSDRFVANADIRGGALLMVCGLLAALARPEGIIVFPVAALLLARAGERRRPLLIASGVFVLLLVVYNVWRVNYFGEWLPAPFMSKGGGGVGLIEGWVRNALLYFVNEKTRFQPLGYYYLLLMVAGVFGFINSRSNARGREVERIGVVLALLLAAVYFNFVDWMPGMRYYVPLIPLLLLSSVHLLSLPADDFRLDSRRRRLLFVMTASVVLAFSLYGVAGLHREADQVEFGNRECHIPLGKWLRSAVPANTLLAISDVGATPYYSRLNTLDINKESLTDMHIAKHDFSVDYVLGRHPGVIVLVSRGIYSPMMGPQDFSIYKSDAFKSSYQFVGTVRHAWVEDRCYWVYFHRNIPITRESVASFPTGFGNQYRTGFEL